MRTTILLLAAVLFGSSAVHAETKVFVIGSDADGYGIDRCLANGAKCGAAMATALCRARDFKEAVTYGKVDRDDITGAVPKTGNGCRTASCDDYVAISCVR